MESCLQLHRILPLMNSNHGWMDGWMDDLQFCILFDSVSVISDDMDDIERLRATEPQAGLEPLNARSAGRHLTHSATGAPGTQDC